MKVCFYSCHLLFPYERAVLLQWKYHFSQGQSKDISSDWSSWNLSNQTQYVTRYDLLFHKAVKPFRKISTSVCGYLENKMPSPCQTVRESDLANQKENPKLRLTLALMLIYWIGLGNQAMISRHRPCFYPRHKWRTLWPRSFFMMAWGLSSVQAGFLQIHLCFLRNYLNCPLTPGKTPQISYLWYPPFITSPGSLAFPSPEIHSSLCPGLTGVIRMRRNRLHWRLKRRYSWIFAQIPRKSLIVTSSLARMLQVIWDYPRSEYTRSVASFLTPSGSCLRWILQK